MFEAVLENPIYLVIIALLGAMIFVAKINEKYFASFKLIYVRRLISVATYSLAGGVALNFFFPEHPLLLRVTMAFLLLFLIQTILYWLLIGLEYSEDTIGEVFYKFKKSVVSFGADDRDFKVKEQLLAKGFTESGAFESAFEDVNVYLFSFDSADKFTRIFVAFMPMGKVSGMLSAVESLTADGKKIITESTFSRTGLLEPRNYDIKRVSFESNPLKLLATHQKRLQELSPNLKEIPSDILEDVNMGVDDSLTENIIGGVMNRPEDWAEAGVLTSDGKCRIWQAMIRSYYFPF